MAKEKSLVEEAILSMKNLEEAVANNAKEILASTMKQEIKELVKKELKIGDDYQNYDELHDLRETGQNDIINGLEGNINALSKTSLFIIVK